jgi:N-acetyl sugar amidotransferase
MLERQLEGVRKRGRGKSFDCIIGMGGGADSSYLIYLAKEKLGLRPLVFHVDVGWNSQTASNNIEKIVDGLNLELFTHVINWNEMRDLQLAFFKSGVPHIDVPQDHACWAQMYRFAEQYDVRSIITGGNISTECVRNPLDFFYYGTDMWQINDIHRRFGTQPLVEFPFTSILRHKVYLRYIKRIQVIQPLDFMPYNKAEAMDFLAKRFGWQPYARKHFESRFTKFYEGYWLPVRFGFDTRRVQYSSMILTGQMTREAALADLEKLPYSEEEIADDFEYVATKLEISVDELRGYLNAPLKFYWDYRNQSHLFNLGAFVLHGLGLERRAKKR